MIRPVPVDNQRTDWPRLVANAINALITRVDVGTVRYMDGGLKYWDGTNWQPVP
jgi:hypothetical protein